MKHGKVPTLRQRDVLEENGLNSTDYLVVKSMSSSITVVSRKENESAVMEKRKPVCFEISI